MSDKLPSGSSLPCGVKVDVLNLVVAPPAVDRGAETSVPGLLQSGEAVFEETLESRLGGFQQGHILKSTMNHRDACMGRNRTGLHWAAQAWIPVIQVNPHTFYRLPKGKLLRILLIVSGSVILANTAVKSSVATAPIFNRIFFFFFFVPKCCLNVFRSHVYLHYH